MNSNYSGAVRVIQAAFKCLIWKMTTRSG